MITLKNRLQNKQRRFLFERYLVKRRLSGEKVFYPIYTKEEIEEEPSRAFAVWKVQRRETCVFVRKDRCLT